MTAGQRWSRLLCAVLFVAGCDEVKGPVVNQEIRERLFFQCLERIPKGPEQTKYNDWDDVVRECGTQAYYMSMNRQAKVPQ
jgi:hypothetical protein